MDQLLHVKDLNVEYKTDDSLVHALNGFSLDVAKGETVGLVGETGAGKTTFALSVLKLLPEDVGSITKGEIIYKGQDIVHSNQKEMRKLRGNEIAMIFQDPMTALNPVLTVGDQIKEVLALHHPEMDEAAKNKRVDEMLTLVGILPERKKQFPHQFSGGMKQRVVIAIALVSEPKLLLADEPTTALDVTIQAQILQIMKELKEKMDSSMVFITHDLGIVMEFCDTIAVCYGGEVIERGTIDEVYVRTANHPYTNGLFSCLPDSNIGAKRLSPISGSVLDPTVEIKGCKFADRCQHCTDRCRNEVPSMHLIQGTHSIKCHLFEEAGNAK